MAIKFAAKDPAKSEPAKSAKQADTKPAPSATVSPKHDADHVDDAVDLFQTDPKPAGRKSKGK